MSRLRAEHLNQLRIGLEEYRARRLHFHDLINHLESHLQAIEAGGVSHFTRAFRDAWTELEMVNALRLDADETGRAHSPVSDEQLNRALVTLETVLQSALPLTTRVLTVRTGTALLALGLLTPDRAEALDCPWR